LEITVKAQEAMQKALNWAYDKAVDEVGSAGVNSGVELAESYRKKYPGDVDKQIDSLIAWQTAKAGTSGFVMGLGGLITVPITLPANIISVLYVQIRMIVAIAYIYGLDVKDDQIKTLCFLCLTKQTITDVAKEIGIQIGTKLASKTIGKINVDIIKAINKAVGFRLLTKFGQKGVINLGKAVPVIGGIVGGTVDVVSTKSIGNFAKKTLKPAPAKKKKKKKKKSAATKRGKDRG